MSLKSKSLLVLAIAELMYGTDANPNGANAVLTSNAQLNPMEGSTVARNIDRATFGADQQLHVGVHAVLTFDVELVGSGTLGTAPAWGKLVKACGSKETITAATSVVYTPQTSSTESLTLYFYLDGQLHKLLGARGTFTLSGDSLTIPMLKFTFTGLWVDPASAVAPAALTGWDDFQVPKPITYDDTPTVQLHGLASVFKSFSFDQGNSVTYFENPGERKVEITDRASKGSVEIIAPKLSDKNYFTAAKANTMGALTFAHGMEDATRVAFVAPNVQLLQPKYGDDQGRATLQADLSFVPTTASDDEWAIRLEAAA
ncbi:phage tail tube protein [Dyella sp. 20L07]|uniref:phage tail tube protein n=1 Tax=Dyella sp. 20L07 TaxID=3384240 RepID=UPI003D2A5378